MADLSTGGVSKERLHRALTNVARYCDRYGEERYGEIFDRLYEAHERVGSRRARMAQFRGAA